MIITFKDWPTDLLAEAEKALQFDRSARSFIEESIDLLPYALASLSLAIDEKLQLLQRIKTLSRFQIDELIRVFKEERAKFMKLYREHGSDVIRLSARSWITGLGAVAAIGGIDEPREFRAWTEMMLVNKPDATPTNIRSLLGRHANQPDVRWTYLRDNLGSAMAMAIDNASMPSSSEDSILI